MEMTMQEILEMHKRIENDPWNALRRQRLQHERELAFLEETRRKKLINDWYTKNNVTNGMDRFLLLQKQECEMLRNLQQAEWHENVRNNKESLENTMGRYLEKEKNEALYKDRYSQYLRENDPSLRKLASQLREAHVNKIRLAQIDEKERNKHTISQADMPYVRALEKRLKEDEEKEKIEIFQGEERKYKLRNLLKQQMEEKAASNQSSKILEEDKVRIEAIVKANLEAIAEEKQIEFEKKMTLRRSYHEFVKEKEIQMLKQKQKMLEEESRLKEYSEFTDSRKDEVLRQKKLREDMLNDVQQRLGELLNRKQRDIDEFEEARQDVAIAQSEMQAFRFEQIEREKKEKAKQKYIAELDKCKQQNEEAVYEERMKDRNIHLEMERITKIKDAEAWERERKKKEKNTIFKNECQADIDLKRIEKDKCLEEAKERHRLELLEDEKYKSDVYKERIRMIKEMAPHLYPGCIPRGMLKEEDIQLLEDPLKNFLLNKKSYPDADLC